MNKFKIDDLIKSNHELYGKYLEQDFYKCKLDKNTTHFISLTIKYIKPTKTQNRPFIFQRCSLKDLYKNIKTIIQLLEKYESIAFNISKYLKCDINIKKI